MKKFNIVFMVISLMIASAAVAFSVISACTINKGVPADKQILMGDEFVLAVNPNGTLFMRGVVGDKPIEDTCFGEWTNIYKIDGGGYIYRNYTAGLTKTGRVIVAEQQFEGDDAVDWKQIDLCSDWRDIVDIAVNEYWIVGLKKDGAILFERTPLWEAWGVIFNNEWPITFSSWHDITSITVMDTYIIGLNNEGTIVYNGPIYGIPEEPFEQAATVCTGFTGLYRVPRIHIFGITKDGSLFYSKPWPWHRQETKYIVASFDNTVMNVIVEGEWEIFWLLFDNGSVVNYNIFDQEIIGTVNINELIGIEKVCAIYSGKYSANSGIVYFVRPNGEVYTFYNSDDHYELRESDWCYKYYSLDGYKMRIK